MTVSHGPVEYDVTLDLVLVVAALAGWGAVTAVAHAMTGFGRPAPGPTSAVPPDDLPPGVVAYLVGGPGTEPAAAATLMDLAARGVVVVEHGAGSAMATVRPGAQQGSSLSRVESLVLARVESLGQGGPIPLPALAIRAGERDPGWADDVRAAVVEATRSRGLSRPRAGPLLRWTLVLAAAAPALAAGVAASARSEDRSQPASVAFAVASLVLIALLGPTWGRFGGERLTRSGRRLAAAWLGHARELGRDGLLRAARPGAVGSWGRRLAYAQALGLARGVDQEVWLGAGDRRRVWSSHGGRWRQVEVRYPRGLFVGRSAPETALLGLWLVGVVGACVFTLFWVPAAFGLRPGRDVLVFLRGAGVVLLLLVTARVLLRIAGSVLEIGTEHTVIGEVVWLQEHHVVIDDHDSTVETYHVAVDDGTSDRTTAWSLPAEFRDRCSAGDHVRMTVRKRSRIVRTIERLTPAR